MTLLPLDSTPSSQQPKSTLAIKLTMPPTGGSPVYNRTHDTIRIGHDLIISEPRPSLERESQSMESFTNSITSGENAHATNEVLSVYQEMERSNGTKCKNQHECTSDTTCTLVMTAHTINHECIVCNQRIAVAIVGELSQTANQRCS
jgi:hypothetical protein